MAADLCALCTLTSLQSVVLPQYEQQLVAIHQVPQVKTSRAQRLDTILRSQATVQLDLDLEIDTATNGISTGSSVKVSDHFSNL